MINKVLIPSDPVVFKQALLRCKWAKRTIFYKDGSATIEKWNASKFKPSSNLMGNIDSQLWHRKDKSEIVKAIYEIVGFEDNDNSKFIEDFKQIDLYICYKKGWSSFVPVNEYVAGYLIEKDEITIFYNSGRTTGRTTKKNIPPKYMQMLIAILNSAKQSGTLAASNTEKRTIHGPLWSYDYRYQGVIGNNCGNLIDDNVLNSRYQDLINTIIKL